MLERAPQVGRRGTIGDRGFPYRGRGEEVAGAEGPGAAGICTSPDLQLMAQPDRALIQGTERQTAPPWRVHQCADLTAAITDWAERWNTDPKPFVWKPPRNRSSPKSDADIKVRRGRETLHRINAQTDH